MSDPLPTAGVLFALTLAVDRLQQNRIGDALVLLLELRDELVADSIAEACGEVEYMVIQ